MSDARQIPGRPSFKRPGAAAAAREEVAQRINEAMSRFDLVLGILEELSKDVIPAASDSDIRHGYERALTSMLAEVAALTPAPRSSEPPGPEERKAKTRLDDERPARLIDPDRLHIFWSLVHRLLPEAGVSAMQVS